MEFYGLRSVIRVVTHSFSSEEKRCVTTVITAVKDNRGAQQSFLLGNTVSQCLSPLDVLILDTMRAAIAVLLLALCHQENGR